MSGDIYTPPLAEIHKVAYILGLPGFLALLPVSVRVLRIVLGGESANSVEEGESPVSKSRKGVYQGEVVGILRSNIQTGLLHPPDYLLYSVLGVLPLLEEPGEILLRGLLSVGGDWVQFRVETLLPVL